MIDGALTTSLILGWLALFLLVSTILSTWLRFPAAAQLTKINVMKESTADTPFVLPSLAIAPLIIFTAWSLGRVNLIFPVIEFSETTELMISAIAPAAVIFAGSGILWRITALSRSEWQFWREKPFMQVDLAYGKNIRRRLAPLVATRVILQASSDCLPLIFSELVVIEAIFNAPGLGYWSWEFAKMRDLTAATQTLLALLIIYGAVNTIIAGANRRLGKKLSGYL